VVKLLLSAGADPNLTSHENFTALIYAAGQNFTKVARVRLFSGLLHHQTNSSHIPT